MTYTCSCVCVCVNVRARQMGARPLTTNLGGFSTFHGEHTMRAAAGGGQNDVIRNTNFVRVIISPNNTFETRHKNRRLLPNAVVAVRFSAADVL